MPEVGTGGNDWRKPRDIGWHRAWMDRPCSTNLQWRMRAGQRGPSPLILQWRGDGDAGPSHSTSWSRCWGGGGGCSMSAECWSVGVDAGDLYA